MDRFRAKIILHNAVESTKPRWSQYAESWKNIDVIFILRGYEVGGFQFFKMKPILEDRGILSIDCLGSILPKYLYARKYERQHFGSLTTDFYLALQKGDCGREGQLFEESVRIFLDRKMGSKGMMFWKLLYQMLQACAYLKQHYSSSFAKYVISKYTTYANIQHVSDNDFLDITISEWECFLAKAKPWSEILGIGPNVFDFIFGDIVEARFAENSYKFDAANQHFFNVTGIARLITPFDREATIRFIKDLEMSFSLREINKGVYTYCSKTESASYGFCHERHKCKICKVKDVCDKNI